MRIVHISHTCAYHVSRRRHNVCVVGTWYTPYMQHMYTYVCSICIRVVAHMHAHVCISRMRRRHMVHTIYVAYVYICMQHMYTCTRHRTHAHACVHTTYASSLHGTHHACIICIHAHARVHITYASSHIMHAPCMPIECTQHP